MPGCLRRCLIPLPPLQTPKQQGALCLPRDLPEGAHTLVVNMDSQPGACHPQTVPQPVHPLAIAAALTSAIFHRSSPHGPESQGPRPGLRCFVFMMESRTHTAWQSAGNTQLPPIWRAPGIRSRSTQTRCLDRPHAAASSATETIVAGGSPASPDPKVPQLGGGLSVIILAPDGED